MITSQLQAGLWQGVRRAWLTIARFGIGAALVGFVLSELGGLIFARGHGSIFVHLISIVVALLAAYGAALTAGIFVAIRSLFRALGDVESGLRSSFGSNWSTIDADSTPDDRAR